VLPRARAAQAERGKQLVDATREWIAEARARWAAARAAAPETGSDGGAYPGRDPPGRDRAGPALPVPRQMLPPNRAS
jgi:hypothetical protein